MLLLVWQADGLFGCSGRTSEAPQASGVGGSHAGRSGTSAQGGAGMKPNVPLEPGVGGAGQAGSGSAMAGSNATGDAGSPDGGSAGQGGSPAQGGSGGQAGSPGTAGAGGHSDGKYMCFNNECGYQCTVGGVVGDPGYDFWVECNKCHCNLNGFADCEQKDCTKDCDWFADEYQAAWGEAQYCMLDESHIDACARTQISSLPCACPSPVSSVVEFEVVSNKWAQKWAAAGCQRLPADQCPPCKPGTGAHCDTEHGVCVYGN